MCAMHVIRLILRMSSWVTFNGNKLARASEPSIFRQKATRRQREDEDRSVGSLTIGEAVRINLRVSEMSWLQRTAQPHGPCRLPTDGGPGRRQFSLWSRDRGRSTFRVPECQSRFPAAGNPRVRMRKALRQPDSRARYRTSYIKQLQQPRRSYARRAYKSAGMVTLVKFLH
jgi:hypothetical protein